MGDHPANGLWRHTSSAGRLISYLMFIYGHDWQHDMYETVVEQGTPSCMQCSSCTVWRGKGALCRLRSPLSGGRHSTAAANLCRLCSVGVVCCRLKSSYGGLEQDIVLKYRAAALLGSFMLPLALTDCWDDLL